MKAWIPRSSMATNFVKNVKHAFSGSYFFSILTRLLTTVAIISLGV